MTMAVSNTPSLEDAVVYTSGFFTLYWCIFLFGYYGPLAPRKGGAKPKGGPTQRIAFANRCCSVCHASTDVIATVYILSQYLSKSDISGRLFLPLTYDQPSDPAFHWVLPVLMGYCLADSLYMFLFERDVLMICHHLAVVIGVLPLYLFNYGWMLAIVATFCAEITNPLQNTWQYTRDYGPNWMYQALSMPFTVAFFILRGIIMPIFLVDYYLFIFFEEHAQISEANMQAIGLCVVIFTMGWLGSLIWLKGVVGGFLRYRRKKRLAEKGKMQ